MLYEVITIFPWNFIVNIGLGTPISGDFTTIDWGSDDHFLNVQINTGGGLTDMGTTQFMAVPYALSAANAASKIDDLTDGKSDSDGSENGSVITSYSIHYTKLYEQSKKSIWF